MQRLVRTEERKETPTTRTLMRGYLDVYWEVEDLDEGSLGSSPVIGMGKNVFQEQERNLWTSLRQILFNRKIDCIINVYENGETVNEKWNNTKRNGKSLKLTLHLNSKKRKRKLTIVNQKQGTDYLGGNTILITKRLQGNKGDSRNKKCKFINSVDSK